MARCWPRTPESTPASSPTPPGRRAGKYYCPKYFYPTTKYFPRLSSARLRVQHPPITQPDLSDLKVGDNNRIKAKNIIIKISFYNDVGIQ